MVAARRTQSIATALCLGLVLVGVWGPSPVFAAPSAPQPPAISAKAAIVLDLATDRVLWSRNARQSRPIASTTKILAVLTALRAGDLDRLVAIETTPPLDDGTIGLRPGDVFSRRQLIYAMLLRSANDAAYVLAQDVGGTVPEFVAEMNDVARRLDTTGVNMVNPHGLPAARHRANALAVAEWSRALLADPELAPVVRTKSVSLGRFGTIYNTNMLLWQDRRVIGVKTGYTDAAGYCLATAGELRDVRVVTVVLGEPSDQARFKDSRTLLTWAFSQYARSLVVRFHKPYARATIAEWDDLSIPLVASSSSSATIIRSMPLRTDVAAPSALAPPVTKGQPVGYVRVYQGPRLLATVPLVASRSVARPTFWDRVSMLWRRASRAIVGPRARRK